MFSYIVSFKSSQNVFQYPTADQPQSCDYSKPVSIMLRIPLLKDYGQIEDDKEEEEGDEDNDDIVENDLAEVIL